MKKQKPILILLGAMALGSLAFIFFLTTGVTEDQRRHPGPSSGDWIIRHWVGNILVNISPRFAQTVDYHFSRVEYILTPGKRRAKALKIVKEESEKWKREFPWYPVRDSVNMSSDMKALPSIVLYNDTFLELFFEDEIRLTLPFKQFYTILSEHDRGHDPVLVALCFRDFRLFHHAVREKKSKGPRVSENLGIQKVLFPDVKWDEQVNKTFTALRDRLQDWKWFHPEFATAAGKANANGLIHRLFYNMKGMEDLPLEMMNYGTSTPGSMNPVKKIRMREQGPLVPYAEWYGKYRTSQHDLVVPNW